MRTYLVVLDETPEARVALRFAARRAARTGGGVDILALIAPLDFVAWGGVQAAMEEEARLRADALVSQVVSELADETGLKPWIAVRGGEPIALVRALLAERPDTAALVLGAAATGAVGPLVSQFGGLDAGKMPCPVMVIPGSLDDAAIDRLS